MKILVLLVFRPPASNRDKTLMLRHFFGFVNSILNWNFQRFVSYYCFIYEEKRKIWVGRFPGLVDLIWNDPCVTLCVCVCVTMCQCVCAWVPVSAYAWVTVLHTYTQTRTPLARTHSPTYTHTHAYLHVYMRTHSRTHANTCPHARTRTYT